MTPKRIGFVGAHNGGKDTLSHFLFTQLKLRGDTAYYISEGAEQAIMQGIKLSSSTGQMWLLGWQMQKEMEAVNFGKRKYIICNRTVLDCVAYSSGMNNAFEIDRIAHEYTSAFPYDFLFWVRPFADIFDDGVRDIDPDVQIAVDKAFKRILDYVQGYIPVKILDAPTKTERIIQIEQVLPSL